MKNLRKSLFELVAADLMTPVVVSVPRQMSLKGAAHLLALNQITGAPVVDDDGRCIGVVSGTDFVVLAGGEKRPLPLPEPSSHPNFCSDWAVLSAKGDMATTVEQVMTPDPVTAHVADPAMVIAREMVDAHIHRIIVVDDLERPVGVISSMDFLAAVAATTPAPALEKGYHAPHLREHAPVE